MSSYPTFNGLADQIVDKKQFNDILNRQQKIFEINPYKIEKLYKETVKRIYSLILNKYQVTKEFKLLEHAWHQNQRRVFVWYMVVFIDTRSLNPQSTNEINWDELCDVFFGKSAAFLEFQFANILKSKQKITWNQKEDAILLEAMSKEKPGKWNQVSKRIFYDSKCLLFKSPKHCRERWFNHLDQSKQKGQWTLNQDYTIFKFIIEQGKRWACIVKLLSNSRTEHMIKNRYNSLICKVKKNKKRREEEIIELVYKSLETEVKNQKREKKLKNQENPSQLKKTEIVQQQSLQLNKIPKSEVLDQEKSDNSTLKNVSVKMEEQPKVKVQQAVEEVKIQDGQSGPGYNQKNFFNFYNDYAQNLMGIQGYPLLYFCQPSAFVPFNSMYPCPN